MIHNWKMLKEFCDEVLSPLEPHEKYHTSLAIRRQHLPDDVAHEFGINRSQMFRRNFYDDRRLIPYGIRQYQNTYHVKNGEIYEVPDEFITVYLSVTPIDCVNGTFIAMTEMVKLMQQTRKGNNLSQHRKALSMFKSAWMKSNSRNPWVDIDIDVEGEDEYIPQMFKDYVGYVVITRGGYHILLKPDDNLWKTVRQVNDLPNVSECVFNRNKMIPTPGTTQGGFPVTYRRL